MNKVIFIILVLFSFASLWAQGTIIPRPSSGSVDTAAGKISTQTMLAKFQFADYVIEKIGSTYYANPNIRSSYVTYSSTNFKTMMDGVMSQLVNGGLVFIKAQVDTGLDAGAITIIYSNITICGAGKNLTKLKLKYHADIGISATIGLVEASNISNPTLQDIELDGNGANQTKVDANASLTAVLNGVRLGWTGIVNNPTIKDCYIHDFTEFGVWYVIVSNGIIKDCSIQNNYWNNITLSKDVSLSKVTNCYFTGSSDASITNYGTDNTVENCFINDVGGGHGSTGGYWALAMEGDGGSLGTPTRCSIINNRITGSHIQMAVALASYAKDFVIRDNTIWDISLANSNTIYILHSDSGLISGNKIIRSINNNILLDHSRGNIISNNEISRDNGFGYGVDLSVSPCNIIKGNYLDSYYGVRTTSGSDSNKVVDNIIKSNVNGADIIDGGIGTIFNKNYGSGKWLAETGTEARVQNRTIIVDTSMVTLTDTISFWRTDRAIVIDSILVVGNGAAMSVTVDYRYGLTRNGAGTAIINSPSASTSITYGTVVTSFNSASIPAGSFVRFRFSAVTTKSQVTIIAYYHYA